MATFILSSGAKGKRFALPHATIHMQSHRRRNKRIYGGCPDRYP
ncbi:MAG: ATP-dependent Clp protease proteolytic subunit [Mangrovibacterium sp.]